jgi:hypothetical protein
VKKAMNDESDERFYMTDDELGVVIEPVVA